MGAGTGAVPVLLCGCAPQLGIDASASVMAIHLIGGLLILVMVALAQFGFGDLNRNFHFDFSIESKHTPNRFPMQ